MDLDKIKELWQNDHAEAPEISLQKQKEIRMPLEKIRTNMRMEFWVTAAIVAMIIAFTPVLFSFVKNDKFVLYFIAFLFSFLLIITIYFLKFFRLYRELEAIDLSLKASLKDLLWKFKLNEQYYLSYYLAFVPLLLFEFAILMDYLPGYSSFSGPKFICTYILFAVCSFASLYFVGKIWFRSYYGRYIHKIINTLKIVEIHEETAED